VRPEIPRRELPPNFQRTEILLRNFHLVPIYRFKDYEMVSITLNRMKQNAQDAGVPMSVLAQICDLRPLRGHPKAANEGHLKTGQRESPGH
jgi:hypothetical protein